MKKKYLSKSIILTTILATCFTIPVIASNYMDTTYNFYFKTSTNGYYYTELREKQDDTSVYMKCNSTTYSYTAHVVGTKTEFGVVYDVSGGHNYTFNSGTVRKMINYVYENGLKYAAVYAERNYSYDYTATGVWSPDSI